MDSVYSKRIRAGKRRTYFFDVRTTRGNDYYLTITESRKRFNDDGYDRHKIFLYKEDFNKFIKALGEAIDHVKTELMPDFDFDAFNHEYDEEGGENGEGREGGYGGYTPAAPKAEPVVSSTESSDASLDEVPNITSTSSTPSTSSTNSAPSTPSTSSTPSTPSTFESDNGSTEEVDKW
jgi:hypothetical protein